MLYITGLHALNIEDSTECCGAWHTSAISWDNIELVESSQSFFGDCGIEEHKHLPTYGGKEFNVANTLRAILDLMESNKDIRWLKGFRNDFICTDIYNIDFFEHVYMLRQKEHWEDINRLMKLEFMWDWDRYVEDKEGKKNIVYGKQSISPIGNKSDNSESDANKLILSKTSEFSISLDIKVLLDIMEIYNKNQLRESVIEILRESLISIGDTLITYEIQQQLGKSEETDKITDKVLKMYTELI